MRIRRNQFLLVVVRLPLVGLLRARAPTYLASRVTLERLGVCQCVGPLVVGAGDLSAS